MGNRISLTKEAKPVVNVVAQEVIRDESVSVLSETSDHDASRFRANPDAGKHILCEQASTSAESLSQKIKSIDFREKQTKVIRNNTIKIKRDVNRKSDPESDAQNFGRSKSLNEMQRTSSRGSTKSASSGVKRNQSAARLRTSNNFGTQQQQYRSGKSGCRETAHPISSQGREIIQACFENHHTDIGHRICMRVFEKRSDYQRFIYALGKERWPIVTNELRDYLDNVVRKIHDVAAMEELSRHYGEQHVPLKSYGFKPDFWVSLADAITLECVILDMANHQPTETVTAWSQLVSLMFTSIRDGYYAALRFQRQSIRRKKGPQRQATIDSTSNLNKSSESIAEKLIQQSSAELSSTITEEESQTESAQLPSHRIDGFPDRMHSLSVLSTTSTKSDTTSPPSSALSSPNFFISDPNTIFY